MNKTTIVSAVLFAVSVTPAHAQGQSSWGVVGSFVPKWHVPPYLEAVAALHFSDDDVPIEDQDLQGREFRVGIARGRSLAGDWGVSFVRRTFNDDVTSGVNGTGCHSVGSAPATIQCTDLTAELTRRDVVLNGFEVHKFIPFVTINERVQVGLNVAGGLGFMTGSVDVKTFETTYLCTFPPGTFPDFGGDIDAEPFRYCAGTTISNVNTVQTGSTTDDVSRMLASDSSMLPIGKAEIAVAAIVAPRLKVRVAGGLNYPGMNAISITGVYFFSDN